MITRIYAVLALTCVVTLASAGRYDITFTPGPTVKIRPLSWPAWNKPYTITNGGTSGVMGGGSVSIPQTSGGPTAGTVECDDAMHATAVWNNLGDPNDLPPKLILIKEYASAGWAGNSGACNNGFGDPPVNGLSEGNHYQVIQNPGTTINFDLTPTAIGNWPFPWGGTCSAGVNWNIKIYPLKIILSGTIDEGTVSHALVGSHITASVIVDGDPFQTELTFSNHQWSIPGETFKRFEVGSNADTGHVTYLQPSDLTEDLAWWSWKEAAEELVVSCTFDIHYGVEFAESASLTKDADVNRPAWELTAVDGPVNYTGGMDNKVLAGGPDIEEQQGIVFSARVSTPTPFLQAWGEASWMYAQLCDLDRYVFCMIGANIFHYRIDLGSFWLDNSWGYTSQFSADWGDPPWNADDSPSQPLVAPSLNYAIHDKFKMYIMFMPPGIGGEWVPLAKMDWQWDAVGSRASVISNWPEPIDGSVTHSAAARTTSHPEWDERYSGMVGGPIPGP